MKATALPLEIAAQEAIKGTGFTWQETSLRSRVELYNKEGLHLVYTKPIENPFEERLKLELMVNSKKASEKRVYDFGTKILHGPRPSDGSSVMYVFHNQERLQMSDLGIVGKKQAMVMAQVIDYANNSLKFTDSYHQQIATPTLIERMTTDMVDIMNYAIELRN